MSTAYRVQILASAQPLNLPYLLQGVISYGRSHGGWSFSLRFTETPRLLEDLAKTDADGIVVSTWDPEVAMGALAAGKPVVSICRRLPQELAPGVSVDNRLIGVMGARHLMDQGYRKFAFCGVHTIWSNERANGFEQTLADAGASCRLYILPLSAQRGFPWSNMQDEGKRVQTWLKRLTKPVAIMCGNDPIAAHLACQCAEMGLNVPGEVAILGVDNVEIWCALSHPPLSSVDPNLVRVGREGAAILHRLLEGEPAPKEPRIVPPAGVRTRESTQMRPPDDTLLCRALDYIRHNIDQPIGVADVLDVVPTSRSSLQRRFRERLGRSPGEEIRRMKLARVCDLLATTDMGLADIAVSTGFEYISHLCRTFKEAYQMTPSEYRRHHRGFSSALIPLSGIDAAALATWREQDSADDTP